jgi:hypothetical protein
VARKRLFNESQWKTVAIEASIQAECRKISLKIFLIKYYYFLYILMILFG